MKNTFCFLVLLALTVAVSAQSPAALGPAPDRFFVATNGNDGWTGKLPAPNAQKTDGPFATIARGQQALRSQRNATSIYVRGGTHFLAQPVTLTKEDSGMKLLGYPGERPVVSGGKPITGWRKGTNNVWTAPVPDARTNQWFFGQMRVGRDLQPRARHPNIDPANPYTGGWQHVVYDGPKPGAFGAVISRINNTNDWIEWSVEVPVDGEYKVAFYYSSANRAFGIADLGGRQSLQAGGSPVDIASLPDTGSLAVFRWQVVGKFNLSKGPHLIRWTNVKGGFMNLDALVLCDDPNWNPAGPNLPPTAPGKNRVIVQAESFTTSKCKEMVVPAAAAPAYRDRFMFKSGDLREFPLSTETEIHMFPGSGWANAILQVRQIDVGNRVAHVHTNINSLQDIRVGNRYFIANALELLDSPGEWYLDRANGFLHYWPSRPDFQVVGVVAPALDRLIEIKGDPAKNQWVEQIVIQGLEFSDTTYSRLVNAFSPGDAAIQLSGARKCVIENNRFVNTGGYAVRVENRSEENEIVGNEMAYTGQGGVLFAGNNSTQSRNCLVAGNWMHHLGQVHKYVAGVHVATGSGIRIANNRMEQLPRFAVSLKSMDTANVSTNCMVEFNDIAFTCMETADSGAIETYGRNQRETGHIIQYNRILDSTGISTTPDGKLLTPNSSWGIHLDEYSSGTLVRGNIVARNELGGGNINSGRNNRFENNIFINSVSNQMRYQVRDAFSVSNQFVRNILFLTEPQTELFKSAGVWRSTALSQSNSNLFWHIQGEAWFKDRKITPQGSFALWQAGGLDKQSVIADPMFTDTSKDDYSLKAGSPVSRIGFEPIPVEKIGLAGFPRSWKR